MYKVGDRGGRIHKPLRNTTFSNHRVYHSKQMH